MSILKGINKDSVLLNKVYTGRRICRRFNTDFYDYPIVKLNSSFMNDGYMDTTIYSLVLSSRRARKTGVVVSHEVASILEKMDINIIPIRNYFDFSKLHFFTLSDVNTVIENSILGPNSVIRTHIGPKNREEFHQSDYYIAVGTRLDVQTYSHDEKIIIPEINEIAEKHTVGLINNDYRKLLRGDF